jgi:tetratricopeptide (TPR) repeat protein
VLRREQAYAGSRGRSGDIAEETLRSLESLGYLASSKVDDSFEFDPSRPDAKDMVEFHRMNMAIRPLFTARRFAEAKELCRTMLAQRPEHVQAYVYLGSIALEEKDYKAVIENHTRYIEGVDPNWEDVERSDDEYARLSRQYAPLKKAHLEVAMAYYRLGDFERALRHAAESVKLGPTNKQAQNVAGTICMRVERMDDAVGHFREALRLGYEGFDAYYNLASALESQGKVDEAIEYYERCLTISGGRDELAKQIAERLEKLEQRNHGAP